MKKLVSILSLGVMFATVNVSAVQKTIQIVILDNVIPTEANVLLDTYDIVDIVRDNGSSISVGKMKRQIIDYIIRKYRKISCCMNAEIRFITDRGEGLKKDDGFIITPGFFNIWTNARLYIMFRAWTLDAMEEQGG